MIDRVAKAIYEQRNGFGAMAWSRRDQAHKAHYIADAKVAIKAMGEPTDRMIEEGSIIRNPHEPRLSNTRATWKAMIDEALK